MARFTTGTIPNKALVQQVELLLKRKGHKIIQVYEVKGGWRITHEK